MDPAIQALTDDLELLQERVPGTRRTQVQREIRQINLALTNGHMSDEEVELRCRTLLEDEGLPRPQRLQLTAFLTEALTFQHRWSDALDNLQAIREYMVEWPLHPQLMARTVHNVGLRVGLAVASSVPECRIALSLLIGGVDASPAPECRPLLSTLISMVAHMPAGHLSLEAGLTCMPFKMQTLRLLEAVSNQDHERIRTAQRDLADHDSTALTRDDEVGWRLLSEAVIASAASMMLRGA